jgi:hypothetical protein
MTNNSNFPHKAAALFFLVVFTLSPTISAFAPASTPTSSLLHQYNTNTRLHNPILKSRASHLYTPYLESDARRNAGASTSQTSSSLSLSIGGLDVSSLPSTLLSTTAIIPLLPSFGINAVLFASLNSKLNKMLTPEGFFHALALGTLLWHTLGWRGWTTCVLYLLLGSLVTKVKFQEKEAMGIAEGRGGRRGPENVW